MNRPVPSESRPATPTPVLPAIRPAFRSVARAVVPETEGLEPDGWADLEAIVEDALAQRPPAMRRQLAIFVRLIDLLPVFRWGRTFRGLDAARRGRFLHGLQSSRIFLFRRGFWGLRTLIYMGYYGRPEAYRAVGYQARLRGWLEHPEATTAAREATARQAASAADAGPDPAARREGEREAPGDADAVETERGEGASG